MIAQIILLPLVTTIGQSPRPFISRCPFASSFQFRCFIIVIFSFAQVIKELMASLEFCVLPTNLLKVHLGFLGD